MPKKLIAPVLCLVLAIGIIMACKTAAPVIESGIRDGILYQYVKIDEGKYGYDFNIPVRYTRFSNESVTVPGEIKPQKYQFRAIWLATVFSMNLPKTDSQAEYKKEYNKILDTYAEWNMNAIIFQVSPLLDAFWPSKHRPWSQYVTGTGTSGKQGVDPGWDPLEWMVAQTHKRGMEYHAWFNPYRVTASPYTNKTIAGKEAVDLDALSNAQVIAALKEAGWLAADNFAVLHPEYTYRYERKFYLDAGIPAVRQHIIDTIKEVIEKYDIDAVHFDDYFYPYGATDAKMTEVEKTNIGLYAKYPSVRGDREQWRRDNNTAMIEGVKRTIDEENKKNNRAIQFGVSPFGIWYRNPPDPRGSATGPSSYTYTDGVYADTWKWVKDETIDYIVPQLYWSFDHPDAPYGELARWWASVAEGAHVDLYIGHGNYKHIGNGDIEPAWMNPEEVLNQLRFNQQYPNIHGNIFFSYSSLLPSVEAGAKYKVSDASWKLLKAHFSRYNTLVPPKPWLKNTAPSSPLNVTRQRDNQITWTDAEGNDSRYYVVYRVPAAAGAGNINDLINDPANIAARVWRDGQTHVFTDTVKKPAEYAYIVTAVNAAHLESAPVIAVKK